ncbi:MAG: hypothetical protein IJ752_01995 [Alphaproteobacteria bacterium]|nr:hypothetical protein [Alphaproteobacteria bacterium]
MFFTILICIASPMNGLLRYAMPLMAAFPLCIGLAAAPALPNVGKEKKEEHD